MNIIKIWSDSKQYNLTTLLYGYLFGNPTAEAHQQQHYRVMEGIMEDLATSTGEMVPQSSTERRSL
jgi:hypothetical protein